MTMKKLLTVMVCGYGIMGCTTDASKDPTKLEFVNTGKSTLAEGETSPRWAVSKTFVDATGRTVTTNPYTYFTLASSDTNVASIANAQYVLGKKPGTTLITATDDKNGKLVTEVSAKITIVAAP